jgi:hypothetical protein
LDLTNADADRWIVDGREESKSKLGRVNSRRTDYFLVEGNSNLSDLDLDDDDGQHKSREREDATYLCKNLSAD